VKLGWGSRQVIALLFLAIILVCSSGLLEITNIVRLATDRARIEGELVSDTVSRLTVLLASESPNEPLSALGEDPRLKEVMASALAHAPTVLTIAVCDPGGIAVAHALPEYIGQRIERYPPVPRPKSLGEAFELLADLRGSAPTWEVSTDLSQGGTPFASVRVHISGTLIWAEVLGALRRGIVTAVVVIALAIGLGVLLGRIASGRVRILEAGVAALREGRFDEQRIPESGVDMFGHLAREINLLRDRVRMEPRVLENVAQLAAGMAHEVHQPLQAIKFSLETLRNSEEMNRADVENHIRTAQAAIDRMHRSVEGFLTVVRLRPMAISSINPNTLLEEVRDTLETEANLNGLELDLDLNPSVQETYGDAQVLRQAIQNLVKNAIQATPSREGRVALRSVPRNGSISIEVEDTGPGIPKELLRKVFNFYFTTKEGGTGVGLALVRQAVEIHGGEVDIDSTVGRGTKVTLQFPIRSSPQYS
jgi:signal transduction histidine kinase